MKIIAGEARRTELEVAPDSTTRPFLEMARGALFNSLGGAVDGAVVLDLYAGSGALGLEALSRGASAAVFVERDPGAAAVLRRNIAKCRMEKRGKVVRGDVARILAAESGQYDLVFLDPPFPELSRWTADGEAGGIMRDAARVLAPDGTLIFRIEDGKVAPPEWPGLVPAKELRHGRSRICRYRRGDAAADAGMESDN